MFTALSALLLGIVEGFTEFLPISSTAHLSLVSNLLHLEQTNFLKTFEIAIQSGAILAVLILYWKKFLDWQVLKRIIIAFIPTGILGLLFYKLIKTYLIGNTTVNLSALAIGGLLLILFEKWHQEKTGEQTVTSITHKQALAIGLFQSIAMIPGVSRSAATILGGMLIGIKRETIVEFSFLLAVPTMLAATGLDLIKNLDKFSSPQFNLLAIGLIASFLMAMISIKFLLLSIRRHPFTGFGVYRIALVILLLMYFTI
ncbi:undecaprenyl-diphosphate phosphatase [Candidatus Uhrbacteria bacterium]|nr:undecaprenyl-diphosphate phosphatase [Candidatus Uhrbacteria bacterium]